MGSAPGSYRFDARGYTAHVLALGFVAAAVSAALAFGGAAMQAFEARKVPKSQSLRLGLLVGLVKRPLWIGGTLLNIVGFGVQVLALSVASLAVVQPTLAVGLIVLAAIAWWKLGEHIDRIAAAGVAGIIVGLVGLAFVAPRRDRIPETPAATAALAAAFVLIVALLAAMRLLGRSGGLAATIAAGLAYAWLSFAGALLGQSFDRHSWLLVGVWAGATVVAAVLALGAEMTAWQSWPVTRSKPVVFVVQTLLPAFAAPFFSAHGFGPAYGIPFSVSLLVVAAGAATAASSGAIADTQA